MAAYRGPAAASALQPSDWYAYGGISPAAVPTSKRSLGMPMGA